MHVRTVSFTGAKDIDAGLTLVRDKAMPILNQQKGYRGITVSANRDAGTVGILTIWDTAEDRDASDSAMQKVRDEAVDLVGGELSVETYEQTVQEIASPAGPGAALAVQPISMDPARIDENLAFFKSTILPEIKANPGFKAIRQLVNRQTGRGVVGTVWADAASRDASLANREDRRARAADRGVEFGELDLREVLLVELK